VFGITCPRCHGNKVLDGEPCGLCEGRGDQYIYRCPASIVGLEEQRALTMWSAFQNGVLPDPGGSYDQAACVSHVIGIINAEKAAIEDLKREGK